MDQGSYIKALVKCYEGHANASAAYDAKAYMREQFDYFGITTPKRRGITKEFLQKHGQPPGDIASFVKALWKMPQRELQYFAMEILEGRTKSMDENEISLFEYMITHRSWWDSIDFIAPKLLGPFLKTHKHLVAYKTNEWIRSGNIWLMRSALLFQVKYKKDTDEELLFSLIRSCAHEKEFFIRKAIGWTLREHSKTFPASVKKFVKANSKILSPLSKKEALKRLSK